MQSKALQAGHGDPSEDIANDAQKRDTAVVVAITTVPLVLVQGDYVGISHVLGDVTSFPAQAEELMKGKGCFPYFKTSSGIPSFLGALPQARPSMAMLSSISVGVWSSSSLASNPGRILKAVSVTMFWVE